MGTLLSNMLIISRFAVFNTWKHAWHCNLPYGMIKAGRMSIDTDVSGPGYCTRYSIQVSQMRDIIYSHALRSWPTVVASPDHRFMVQVFHMEKSTTQRLVECYAVGHYSRTTFDSQGENLLVVHKHFFATKFCAP
jgi:hypothetical protein